MKHIVRITARRDSAQVQRKSALSCCVTDGHLLEYHVIGGVSETLALGGCDGLERGLTKHVVSRRAWAGNRSAAYLDAITISAAWGFRSEIVRRFALEEDYVVERRRLAWEPSLALLGVLTVGRAHAQGNIGTAFTYQGHLENGSGPVTDTCDFRFGLWDAASGGTQWGGSREANGDGLPPGLCGTSEGQGSHPNSPLGESHAEEGAQ